MKYPKTRQALAVYDAWKSHVWDNARSEDIDVVLAEEERFGRAVGRAFGEETKAFNSPETCEGLVRPCKWLRNLLNGENTCVSQ